MSEFLQSDRIANAKGALDRLRANMRQAILGKDDVIEQLLICLAAGLTAKGVAVGGWDDTQLFQVRPWWQGEVAGCGFRVAGG